LGSALEGDRVEHDFPVKAGGDNCVLVDGGNSEDGLLVDTLDFLVSEEAFVLVDVLNDVLLS